MADLDNGLDQLALIDVPEWWEPLWKGMPEFIQTDVKPSSTINVQFQNDDDRRAFLELMGEKASRVKSIWFPSQGYLDQSEPAIRSVVITKGQYPIYVISKGRADTRLTGRALEKLGLDYRMVIEPNEFEDYAAVMDERRILVLPFQNLGQGSIPARNWVWEHSLEQGAVRHWILDDNLDGFYRLNRNLKRRITDENPFLPVEQFADRYSNVALAGLNYEFFADRRSKQPPFRLNTRIYSCILIQNDIPYRWRGRYNEDTDLSLRALKDGWVTVLFNAYLCKKLPTMKLQGGNTAELYQGDGRKVMAESLAEQHPDVASVSVKWNRHQHHVDYSPFKANKLIPIEDG